MCDLCCSWKPLVDKCVAAAIISCRKTINSCKIILLQGQLLIMTNNSIIARLLVMIILFAIVLALLMIIVLLLALSIFVMLLLAMLIMLVMMLKMVLMVMVMVMAMR